MTSVIPNLSRALARSSRRWATRIEVVLAGQQPACREHLVDLLVIWLPGTVASVMATFVIRLGGTMSAPLVPVAGRRSR